MSGPAAKLTGSIFDPQQPFGPPASSSSSSSSLGTDYNRVGDGNDDNNDDDDDDLASLRPFVMDTAQAQGLGPLRDDGEPGMGSYEAASPSMLPDIEMTTPLPVAVVASNGNDNDNSDIASINVNGNYGSGDGGDYDMTAAFLPYKPPPSTTTPPVSPPAMTSPAMSSPAVKTATDAGAVTGTVLSAKVDLGLLTLFCYTSSGLLTTKIYIPLTAYFLPYHDLHFRSLACPANKQTNKQSNR